MADPDALLGLLSAPDSGGDAAPAPVDKTDALIGMLNAPAVDTTAKTTAPTAESRGFFSDIKNAYENKKDPNIKYSEYFPVGRKKTGELTPAWPGLIQDAARMTSTVPRAWTDPNYDPAEEAGNASKFIAGGGFAPKFGRVAAAAAKEGVGAIKDAAGNAVDSLVGPAPKTLTSDQLKSAASKSYNEAESAGVTIKPEAFQTFVDDLAPKMKKQGFDYGLHPQADRALSRLQSAAVSGEPQTLPELETLRKVASSARLNAENDDQAAKATTVINHIDNFMKNLTPEQTAGGNAPRAVAALNTARPLWGKAMKIEDIQEILDIAKRQDDPNKYIQSQFGRITRDPDWYGQFKPDERKIIDDVAKTGKLDAIGKLLAPTSSPTTIFKYLAAPSAGFMLAGPAGASVGAAVSGLMPLAGSAAKMAGKSARASSVEDLKGLISRGGPEPSLLSRYKATRAKNAMKGRDYLMGEKDYLLPD